MTFSDRAAPSRDAAALAASLVLAGAVAWLRPPFRQNAAPPPQARAVQLSIAAAPETPIAPPPPIPPPPAPPTPPAAPEVPVPPHPMAAAPLPALPVSRAAPRLRPPPAAATQTAPAAAFDVPATAAAPRDAREEDRYVAGLHAYLAARTVPPDTAAYRLLHPHGTADIGFSLTRAGELRDVRVLRGSGSPLLDAQAVAIVQNGRYPPIPKGAFAGEAQHAFHIPIEFEPAGDAE